MSRNTFYISFLIKTQGFSNPLKHRRQFYNLKCKVRQKLHPVILEVMAQNKSSQHKKLLLGGGAVLVLIILFGSLLLEPKRSTESFCKTFSEEKVRLATVSGEAWSSAVFDESAGDAGEFASSFSKLERVAPDDIRPSIESLRKTYEEIDKNPSSALSASLGGLGAEQDAKNWIKHNCKVQ